MAYVDIKPAFLAQNKVAQITRLSEVSPNLGGKIEADLRRLNINSGIVSVVRTMSFEGFDYPTHYGVELNGNGFHLDAWIAPEIDYQDGKQRQWDARIFVMPAAAFYEGEEIVLPDTMKSIGYHILVKTPQTMDYPPLVRIDSLCVPSMIDGHYASHGDKTLGCDCEPQRHLAQDIIADEAQKGTSGGYSILSPLSGRGNGTFAHIGQLAIQNFANRYGLAVPNTYQSHELQGYPKDKRLDYYWLDALIAREVLNLTTVRLMSNNPQKKESLERFGIQVKLAPLFPKERAGYYEGKNFLAKVTDGRHIPPV